MSSETTVMAEQYRLREWATRSETARAVHPIRITDWIRITGLENLWNTLESPHISYCSSGFTILFAKDRLGEVCGKDRQFKIEGGKRPSGICRAAFQHELYMDVGTISSADKRGKVRNSQTI